MGIFSREVSPLDKKIQQYEMKELQKKKKTLLAEKRRLAKSREERHAVKELKRDIRSLKTEKSFEPLYNVAKEGKRIYRGFHKMAAKTSTRTRLVPRTLEWGSGGGGLLGGMNESHTGRGLMAGMSSQGKHNLGFERESERPKRRSSGKGKTIIIKF